jgi:competence protein ComEA
VTSRTRARASERLRDLTRTAYTAAAGHLEVEPEAPDLQRRRFRWAVRPRVAVAGATAIVVIALGAGAWLLGGTAPQPVVIGSAAGASSEAEGPASPDTSGAQDGHDQGRASSLGPGPPGADGAAPPDVPTSVPAHVVVHVAGHVTEPGVVELPAGARVFQAIAEAGGASADADLSAVNLARVLADGEQVYVPAPGEQVPGVAGAVGGGTAGGGAGPGAGTPTGGPVNLNTASTADLDGLPGIGPVLAERILAWRQEHGRFTLVDELSEVEGIGPTLLGRLRDLVTV